MASKHDEPLDLGQPALILIHGESVRKHRTLPRDATAVGRAHGCDICLEAPDISALHCLITRRGSSLLIRDCGSRSGTHLNGDVIRDQATLQEGDILQVGPFSFRIYLPASPTGRPSREQRLERSRRRLTRLALGLRQRLRQHRSGAHGQELEQKQAELDRQTAALRDRVRDYEQRFERLNAAERDLTGERETLSRETEALHTRIREFEAEAARKKTAEASVDSRGTQAMSLEQQANAQTREAMESEPSARLEQQRAALAQAEASLREQRAGLTRMVAELKQMQEALRNQQNSEVEALRKENEQLHQLLAEHDRERVEAADADPSRDLRAEVNLLRHRLQEKDALLEQFRGQPDGGLPAGTDMPGFEAELHAFQRQLENDRRKLNEEIEQLRSRNVELDEATRDMELQLSRERAELAQRQRLDRLREETRLELEKMQREATVRDRLAPVKRLREEIAGGSAAST